MHCDGHRAKSLYNGRTIGNLQHSAHHRPRRTVPSSDEVPLQFAVQLTVLTVLTGDQILACEPERLKRVRELIELAFRKTPTKHPTRADNIPIEAFESPNLS